METFNITLPTNWAELSDKQLLMVYRLFARDLSAAEVKTLCLMKWNSLKVLATLPRHPRTSVGQLPAVARTSHKDRERSCRYLLLTRADAGVP